MSVRYARVSGGKVVEIFINNTGFGIAQLFHADLNWVACDPGVNEGWLYKNGVFSPSAKEELMPLLSDAKAAKLARIRDARHAVEFGGMMHDGVMYDSDATARAKYGETRDVFALMPDMVVEGWKASDGPDGLGVYVTMTKALLDALTLAGAAHDKACFDWERDRQAEVAAAQTVVEVAAVSEVVG